MLSLGRTPGQYIVVDVKIVIQVLSVGNSLRLAIDAPQEVKIVRGENYEKENPAPSCIRRSRQKGRIQ